MNGSLPALFRRLSHGVYVVGVASGEQRNAFTAAWVMQVSFKPLMLALSINPLHSSCRLLKQGGVFSINVLKKDQVDLAAHYGGPANANKLARPDWQPGRTGAPLLDDALACFECEVAGECVAGDHLLVTGRVVAGRLLDHGATPLLYRDLGDLDGAAALFPNHFDS